LSRGVLAADLIARRRNGRRISKPVIRPLERAPPDLRSLAAQRISRPPCRAKKKTKKEKKKKTKKKKKKKKKEKKYLNYFLSLSAAHKSMYAPSR